jgi:hypothetical protein
MEANGAGWKCWYGARFRRKFALEDAIDSHVCALEASRRVTNGIPLGCLLLLPVGTVNSVQTLKAREGASIARMSKHAIPELATFDPNIVSRLQILAMYRPLLQRQNASIKRYREEAAMKLPDSLDYSELPYVQLGPGL